MSGYGYMFNESEIPQSVKNGLELFGKIQFGTDIHYIIEKDNDGTICLFSTTPAPDLKKADLKTVADVIEANGNQLKLRDFINTLNFIEKPEAYKDMPVDEIREALDIDFLKEYSRSTENFKASKARLISFTDKDIPLYIKDRIYKACFDKEVSDNSYIYIFKDEFYNDNVVIFNDDKDVPTVYKAVSELAHQLKDERTNPDNINDKIVMGDIQGSVIFFKKLEKLTGLSVSEIEQKIDSEYLNEGTVHSVITAYANFDQEFIDNCHLENKGIGRVTGYRFEKEMTSTECGEFSVKGLLMRTNDLDEPHKFFKFDEVIYVNWDGGHEDIHSEYMNSVALFDDIKGLNVTPTPKYEVATFEKEEPVFEKDDILDERA